MNTNNFDHGLFEAALEGLKSYHLREFAAKFVKKKSLGIDRTLDEMWTRIESWIGNDANKCRDLMEYVDDLRLWGRQRIFLYEVEEEYAAILSDPLKVKKAVDSVYDKPLFKRAADEPSLAMVKHDNCPNTGAPLLLFKLIENRKYKKDMADLIQTFEERSTNFFIINLQNKHAELRIQQLPTGAVKDLKQERALIEATLGEILVPSRESYVNYL